MFRVTVFFLIIHFITTFHIYTSLHDLQRKKDEVNEEQDKKRTASERNPAKNDLSDVGFGVRLEKNKVG